MDPSTHTHRTPPCLAGSIPTFCLALWKSSSKDITFRHPPPRTKRNETWTFHGPQKRLGWDGNLHQFCHKSPKLYERLKWVANLKKIDLFQNDKFGLMMRNWVLNCCFLDGKIGWEQKCINLTFWGGIVRKPDHLPTHHFLSGVKFANSDCMEKFSTQFTYQQTG